LFQYRFLTDTFYKTLLDHRKKVDNGADDLKKVLQGALSQPSYVVVLLDQTDQGGLISGTICVSLATPKSETREEEEVLDEENPAIKPKKVKNTYVTYELKSSFDTKPFTREARVNADGTTSVREITNPELFPEYALLFSQDYQQRVKSLKIQAALVQSVQNQLETALKAELTP
jgi:hypothetical protein